MFLCNVLMKYKIPSYIIILISTNTNYWSNPLIRGAFQVIQEEEILQICIEISLSLSITKGHNSKTRRNSKRNNFYI